MRDTPIDVDSQTGADDNAGEMARVQAYRLLGTLLANTPSAELIESLRGVEIPETDSVAGMTAAWRDLRAAAQDEAITAPEALDDEYHALFIGVGRGELLPYASWYLTGFLMEKPLSELRADLARLGFERQESVCEPEDHAAALCEIMGMIIINPSRNSVLDQRSFDTQRAFFYDHLKPWMGTFFRDLQKAESAAFYRAVGQFGERFIELEQQYFAMMA